MTRSKTAIERLAGLPGRSGVSPKQFLVICVGLAAALVSVLSTLAGWSKTYDISLVVLFVALISCMSMLLRAVGIKAASIRRDILREGQRQAAVSRRIEANTGLSQASTGGRGVDPTVGNSLGHKGKYFGVGPEYEYAWRAAQNLSSFETFALRTKSLSMRDVFARVATGLQYNFADLMRLVRTSRAVRMDNVPAVVKRWNSKGLLTLARVVTNQRLKENDAATAILLFELCIKVFGTQSLGKTDQRLFLEALDDVGRYKEAARWLKEFKIPSKDPVQAGLFKANLIRSDSEASDEWTVWLERVNSVLATDGLDPIQLVSRGGMPLDRLGPLYATPSRPKVNHPLVSVIIPTHDGSELIDTALNSIQSQTWTNIEILVVDDCSQPRHVQRLREICAGYANVSLFLQETNAGAYVARNRALEFAKGEFVTVHDDDDWSHPEKIQRQAEALIKDPAMVANMSMHSRVTDGLKFMRVNNNTSFSQPNYSSIMFRRSLLEEIGKWDSVNRGADAEFRDRIKNVLGASVEVIGTVPLSFTRTRTGSLTFGELDRGYIDPARLIYLDSYTQAHRRGITGGRTDERQFAAPLDMLPGHRGQHKGEFDVVFATDFRFPGGTTSLTVGEIRIALGMGLRVGVLQLDSPLNKPGTPIAPAMLELLTGDQASLLRVRDEFHARLLLVRHPSVVQFLDTILSPASVGQCLLVANTAPVLAGGSGNVYDLEQCVANIDRCFSVSASVVPESGVTRRLVREVVGDAELTEFDWPGFVRIDREIVRRPSQRRPVVGRHSRDNRLKWPDALSDFMAAYHQPRVFDTHILGGIDSIKSSVPEAGLRDIRVTPFGGAEVREYLQEIDFWVYYHSDRTIESFGMAAAEAMEAGLVVILPSYMSATFGAGAIYAEPSKVPEIVARYWNDPELYNEQSRRAREYVREHYSEPAYRTRLASVLDRCRKGEHGLEIREAMA